MRFYCKLPGRRHSSSYYFVDSQSPNLFYLDPHHACATVPLQPPMQQTQTQATMRECGIPIRQAMPERGSALSPPPGHHRSPTSPASSHIGFSYPTASPSPLSKQLSTSSSSSRGAHVRWNSAGANANGGGGGGSVLSGEADSEAGLDVTQTHYVTSYSAAELRTFHCERVRKTPLLGLDPSMLIGFLCKTEADWNDLRRRVAEVRVTQLFVRTYTNGFRSYSRTIRRSFRSSMSPRRGRMLTIASNRCRILRKTKTTCRKIKTPHTQAKAKSMVT